MTQLKSTFLILIIGLIFTSCVSDELAEPTEEFSDEEVQSLLFATLNSPENGMIYDIQQFVEELVKIIGNQEYCNNSYEFVIEDGHETPNSRTTFNGQVNGEVSCVAGVPLAATVFASTSLKVNSIPSETLSITGESEFSGEVAAFIDPISLFPLVVETGVNIAGNYNRIGSTVTNRGMVNTTLAIDLADLTVTALPVQDIQSGVGTFTFIIANAEDDLTLDGSLVFHGDKSLTLTINGEEFPYSWE